MSVGNQGMLHADRTNGVLQHAEYVSGKGDHIMLKKNWKMIAAVGMSFSLAVSAGIGAYASSKKESRETSTLEIAGAQNGETEGEQKEDGGSLLDLAGSMEQNNASEEQDGLLALIDGSSANEENGDLMQAEPAPEAEDAASSEPEAVPAPEEEMQPEPEPAPEAGATLETASADDQSEPAPEEKVTYEKLSPTGSVTEGILTQDVSAIVEATMPSIVAVTTTSVQKVRDFFSNQEYEYEAGGAGSGIIVSQNDDELLIATNHHITKDSKELSVCFSVDAEKEEDLVVPAVLKGESNKADLAVIAVKLSDIKPEIFSQLKIATLGNSDTLKVGEAAIVIGNALGFGQSVSAGIVSALDREIETELGKFKEFMIDAPINLGCSGGAILNSKGEVIGIVNAKDVNDYAESMGYGVPIDTAIPILQDLINRETREAVDEHGYLGVTVVPVSEEARDMYGMPSGAYVYEVTEGSAAEAAGIAKGNIITAFDGIDIGSSDDLVRQIGYYAAGETVKVEIQVSDGTSYVAKEVDVTLQEGTEEQKQAQKQENEEEEKSSEKEEEIGNDPGSSDGNGYYYGQDGQQGYGFGDPFGWFFGNNGSGNNGGWGSFYYGN